MKFVNLNSFLGHGVTVADGHGVFFVTAGFAERFKINRHTERCPNLVLGEITFTDVAPIVPSDIEMFFKFVIDAPRFFHQFRFVFQ